MEEKQEVGHRKRATDVSRGGTVTGNDEVCRVLCLEDTTWK